MAAYAYAVEAASSSASSYSYTLLQKDAESRSLADDSGELFQDVMSKGGFLKGDSTVGAEHIDTHLAKF